MSANKVVSAKKILDDYIDFLINVDYSTFDDSYKGASLRLGTTFLDRVRTAYESKLEYNGKSIVELVDNLHLKTLDKFDDKIEYLFDLLKTITHKDHPLLVFMFFGTDHIKSDIYKKLKR